MITYFVISFIFMFSLRITEHYQGATLPIIVHILGFLFWPIAIVFIMVTASLAGLDTLAKAIAHKIRKNKG